MRPTPFIFLFFFFNDTATTEIYTLSLHDALPISSSNPTPLAASSLKHHLPLRADSLEDYRRQKKAPLSWRGFRFLRHRFDDRVVRCQLVRSAPFGFS